MEREIPMAMRLGPTRRHLLLGGGLTIAATGIGVRAAMSQGMPPTPACTDGDEPTHRQGPGPFYKSRSPQRSDLREPESKGVPFELTGLVLTRSCRPVSRALVDLWHADENGYYDNDGFRYRGHVFTDGAGRFRFRTIMPAVYVGRTRHFHVKVQAPHKPVLTTQLYFPGEPANARDFLFDRRLLMRVASAGDGRFDFILDLG
jgi:protocatechuate 3,4-dioxygenase beta subunit